MLSIADNAGLGVKLALLAALLLQRSRRFSWL